MFNDPELNARYMGSISSDFVRVADQIKEASYALRSRGISRWPIFPISRTALPIGALLIGKTEGPEPLAWHYYMSFAEEFVQRDLIAADRLPAWEAAYKDPDEYCCLFVVDTDFTNFVFIPYPEE